MLLTLGKLSHGDFGEESLVARFLLAMILNEYAAVNHPRHQAFCAFGSRCLSTTITSKDVARATATVELQADRCNKRGNATTFDAFLTLEPDEVWGIEAKYFDSLKCDQIEREAQAIYDLAAELGYGQPGLLFLVPEQQLGTILLDDGDVHASLAKLMREDAPKIRVASWEIIFEILCECGTPQLKEELLAYCSLRNCNTAYPAKLSATPSVPSWREWQMYILGECEIPAELPRLAHFGHDGFSRFGQASATVNCVFDSGPQNLLAQEILQRARCLELHPKAQKNGYVNLSRRKRAYAQIHPHPQGLALVVREAAGALPASRHLKPIPYQSLIGYRGSNKTWLDGGGGRYTNEPAAAVLVPMDLIYQRKHPGWNDVDAVLKYACMK